MCGLRTPNQGLEQAVEVIFTELRDTPVLAAQGGSLVPSRAALMRTRGVSSFKAAPHKWPHMNCHKRGVCQPTFRCRPSHGGVQEFIKLMTVGLSPETHRAGQREAFVRNSLQRSLEGPQIKSPITGLCLRFTSHQSCDPPLIQRKGSTVHVASAMAGSAHSLGRYSVHGGRSWPRFPE